MADPVRDAIFAVLVADGELDTLATGVIHYRIAPDDATTPYVVFNKMAGTRIWAFDGPPILNQVWLVKGIGDPADAEDIDLRCQAILSGASLTFDDYELRLAPMPEDDVSYGEVTDGEQFDHVGTNYRVMLEEGSS